MATEPEDPRTDEVIDEEGGPVKSFLDHLEDLRWVLIKTLAAVGIGMLVCLIGANTVMAILERPLQHGSIPYSGTNQIWTLAFGGKKITTIKLTDEQQRAVGYGTNRFVAWEIGLTSTGTNMMVSLTPSETLDAKSLAQQLHVRLRNLGPVGAFFVAIQLALYGGLVLASPFIFYFIAGFIFPALRMREKHYVYRGLGFGLTLFLAGVSFCYFVLMPVALSASVGYSNWLGFEADEWRAEEYISFVCKFMIGMGIGFQLPVVLLTLVKIGVLSYTTLSKMRRYMIVINLVLGALLTTPEVVTQVLMAVPLQLLYEASVGIAWYWERRDRKRAEAERKREANERRRTEGGVVRGK